MSYLYDEVIPTRRADLQAHLDVCPDCRLAVQAWRRAMDQLDSWTLPGTSPKAAPRLPALRWAAAAAIVLATGFLAGRLSAPPPVNTAALRAELKQEFSAQLQESLAASRDETQQTLETITAAWATARQQDQQTTLALLQRAEQNRQLDFATLRRDLETVALVGETGLRTTRNQLARLASYDPTDNPNHPSNPNPLNPQP